MLSKSRPGVLKDIAFYEHALSVFDLKEIFYYEGAKTWGVEARAFCRVVIDSAYKTGLALHPRQRLKKIVVTNFDVRGRCGSRRPAKQNIFGSGFYKIVLNFPDS